MNFNEFNFHPKITAGIQSCRYETPTPIQEQAIPAILAGRDIMGLAQTGTGKTAAFALPVLQRLLKGPRGKIRTLVVAPTRELAEQIHNDFIRLGKQTGLRSAAIYGGVGKMPQIKRIRAGAEIVVACPGRLLDHLNAGAFDLNNVEHLVLDEADHMFDMGFLPDIRRILKYLPGKRQTLLFSATMPGEIRHLAEEILNDPVRVQIAHSRPAATVGQVLFTVEQNGKSSLLRTVMANTEMGPTLIFTRTKYRAVSLARQLAKAGYTATSLQGNLSQQKRQKALEGFKRGEFKVLVATDIAARGIDVSGISHVINFDVPDTVEAYTHRIGRTGRAASTGEAFTFAGREDRKIISQIERTLGKQMIRVNSAGLMDESPSDQTDRVEKRGSSSEDRAGTNAPATQRPHGRPNRKKAEQGVPKKRGNKRPNHSKTGSSRKRRGRAAIMSKGSGNLFLDQ